jgi:hypothetical protein
MAMYSTIISGTLFKYGELNYEKRKSKNSNVTDQDKSYLGVQSCCQSKTIMIPIN